MKNANQSTSLALALLLFKRVAHRLHIQAFTQESQQPLFPLCEMLLTALLLLGAYQMRFRLRGTTHFSQRLLTNTSDVMALIGLMVVETFILPARTYSFRATKGLRALLFLLLFLIRLLIMPTQPICIGHTTPMVCMSEVMVLMTVLPYKLLVRWPYKLLLGTVSQGLQVHLNGYKFIFKGEKNPLPSFFLFMIDHNAIIHLHHGLSYHSLGCCKKTALNGFVQSMRMYLYIYIVNGNGVESEKVAKKQPEMRLVMSIIVSCACEYVPINNHPSPNKPHDWHEC